MHAEIGRAVGKPLVDTDTVSLMSRTASQGF